MKRYRSVKLDSDEMLVEDGLEDVLDFGDDDAEADAVIEEAEDTEEKFNTSDELLEITEE